MYIEHFDWQEVFCNDKRKTMQWADLGVGILQGNQRAEQGKWLH